MFRLMGKRREGVFAVADIASGSAGVAIVKTNPSGAAHVIASERAVLPFEERSPQATASGVIAQLEEAAQKALTAYVAREGKSQSHVSAAYAVIRAPWSTSKASGAESVFDAETPVDEGIIKSLAEEAIKSDANFDRDRVFETSVVRVELNGYPTAQPKGKYAHSLVVTVLKSECDPSLAKSVGQTLGKVFSCPPPTMRSDMRAFLSVLRENSQLPQECLIVNMTSHGTLLAAIRKGVVAETFLVPEGNRSILGRVAKDKMPEEALTLIRMLALDQCEEEACEAVAAALAQAETELAKVFGEALGKMSSARRLPNTLIFSAHEDLARWLENFFTRIDFAQFTTTTRPFTPQALSRENLAELASFESGVKYDTGLAVASALVNIENKNGA